MTDAVRELKPCPFCGGPAEWTPGNYKGRPMCQHCGSSAPDAEKWNRRAAEADPVQRAEREVVRAAEECVKAPWSAAVDSRDKLIRACAALARARKEAGGA